jgi:tetratricopeptide (TPR) repeat protein
MVQRSFSDAADAAMRAGNIRAAVDLLEQHLAAAAPRPNDYLKLAAARRALGDLPGSLDALTHELEIAPGNLPALLMSGSLLTAMGRTEEASTAYEAALIQNIDESRLPPPIRDQIAKARITVDAKHARRRFIEALTFDDPDLDAPARRRLEQFRDIVLAANQAGIGRFLYPDLPERNFHDAHALFGVRALEAASHGILQEFRRVIETNAAEVMSLVDHAEGAEAMDMDVDVADERYRRWSTLPLINNGTVNSANAALCPLTMRLYEASDPCTIPGRAPNLVFSLLDAGARIPAHRGLTNVRLVLHIPLIAPPDCALRVGNDVQSWEWGRAMLFDDTVEHEAWNESDRLRVVLLCDQWRPELSQPERRGIEKLLGAQPA